MVWVDDVFQHWMENRLVEVTRVMIPAICRYNTDKALRGHQSRNLREVATLSKLQPYLKNRANLGWLITCSYLKTLNRDIDQNPFQPYSTTNKRSALQENNVARNETILKEETEKNSSLSEYTDDEKRLLETIADEERSKGIGFM